MKTDAHLALFDIDLAPQHAMNAVSVLGTKPTWASRPRTGALRAITTAAVSYMKKEAL